jgi:peptide/nickel transport system substrate-binding protein
MTRLVYAVLSAALLVSACSPGGPAAKPTEAAKSAAPTAAPAKPAASPAGSPAAASPVAAAQPAVQPRSGGELTFIVGAEPPSFDGHRETTFAMIHPTAPHYSLLLKFDPENYPKVVGDLAESWNVSPDGLTYTFKLRSGVRFHDGSTLTSKDVKASYDRIINPPQGVVSARKASYSAVESVDAPAPDTVVFRLKFPSAAMLANLASPWNYIYKADLLEQDPRWPEKNIMGTGPFKFGEYVPGSHWTGVKNDDYFDKGKPYLDSFRAIFITDPAAQVAAIRGGRAQIEFRGFTPSARDDLVRAMGDQITVQESTWLTVLIVAINTEKPPFNDARVRRALTLAMDRWEGSKALSQIAFVRDVGGLMRTGSPFAMPESDLEKIAGYGHDINAARTEARRLLQEAGVPQGFTFKLLNRNVPMPYEPTGVFLIDQWRRIGIEVTQQVEESAQYLTSLRQGNYDVAVDFSAEFMDEPDIQLAKYLSTDRSPLNYGRHQDKSLDELYDRQSRETNPDARKQLVAQFERKVMDEQAYAFPVLWWYRIIPHSSKIQGWKISPTHYINQDLSTVWLLP